MSQIIIDTNDSPEMLDALAEAARIIAERAAHPKPVDAECEQSTASKAMAEKFASLKPSFPAIEAAGKSTAEESTDATPAVEPSPAPVATAASTAPTATPESSESSTPAGAELDVNGLPWDHRIHSEARSKMKGGEWKRKRNTAASGKSNEEWTAYIAEVEAELRRAMGAPAAAVGESTPTAVPAPVATAPASPVSAPNVAPQPAAPAVSPTPATPTAPAAAPPPLPKAEAPIEWTYVTLVQACASNGWGPEVTQPHLDAVGVPSMQALAARADLVPAVAASLGLA